MKKKARAPYKKPTLTQLTHEEARVKLTAHADQLGKLGAKYLLELMKINEPQKSRADKNPQDSCPHAGA